jgi:hypothetical protein
MNFRRHAGSDSPLMQAMPLAYAICLLLGLFAIVAGFSRRSEPARVASRPCSQTDTNAPFAPCVRPSPPSCP